MEAAGRAEGHSRAARSRLELRLVFAQLESGRQLKILPVLDNYTRECLGILVAHNITARNVTEFLQQLVSRHGTPQFIRSDNRPELIARHVKAWLADCGISTDIEPGSPWQNSYSESFNSRFRDELLNAEIFTSLRGGSCADRGAPHVLQCAPRLHTTGHALRRAASAGTAGRRRSAKRQ